MNLRGSSRVRWVLLTLASLAALVFVSFKLLEQYFADYGEDQAVVTICLMEIANHLEPQRKDGRLPRDIESLFEAQAGPRRLRRKDPWGHPYGYELSPSSGVACRIYSLGADGMSGGNEAAEDLVMWGDTKLGWDWSRSLEQVPSGYAWQ
jgi:hypothetical protein